MTLRKSQVKLLGVKGFANTCQTTPRTLRFYDQKGILKPYRVDVWNKYRYYHPDQVLNFAEIKLLQTFNLSINKIGNFKEQDINKFISNELESVKNQISEIKKRYLFLTNISSFLWKKNNLDLKIKNIESLKLFCVRIEKGNYSEIGSYIQNLWSQASKLRLNCEKKEILFYLDPYFKPKDTKLEIALILKNEPKSKQALQQNYYFRQLPKTKAYFYRYAGPYDYLSLIYQRLDYHFLIKKLNIKQPVFEIYTHGPYNTKSPYDYVTEIYYPF